MIYLLEFRESNLRRSHFEGVTGVFCVMRKIAAFILQENRWTF